MSHHWQSFPLYIDLTALSITQRNRYKLISDIIETIVNQNMRQLFIIRSIQRTYNSEKNYTQQDVTQKHKMIEKKACISQLLSLILIATNHFKAMVNIRIEHLWDGYVKH